MSKLEQVLKFMNRKNKGAFTWKEFMAHFGGTYPNTYTTYLSLFVKAQYVIRGKRGHYLMAIPPARGMGYAQLKKEAGTNWNTKAGVTEKFFYQGTIRGRLASRMAQAQSLPKGTKFRVYKTKFGGS